MLIFAQLLGSKVTPKKWTGARIYVFHITVSQVSDYVPEITTRAIQRKIAGGCQLIPIKNLNTESRFTNDNQLSTILHQEQ